MTRKIFRSIVTVAILVLLSSLTIITGYLARYFEQVQEQELRDELMLAAVATQELGESYLQQIKGEGYRLTWVDSQGVVLYDTQVDAGEMENHGDRDEIRQALQTGRGSSSRYSSTLTQKTLYQAQRLDDGTVLRISVSHLTAVSMVLGMVQPIGIAAILAIVFSALLANRMSKRVIQPLNQLNLEEPLENDVYEELSPLLRRIYVQHQQIDQQMRDLRQRTDEFEQITGNMREGLVLLDKNSRIVSINPAARELFHAGGDCVGEDFLTVDRKHDLQSAMEEAFARGHSEMKGKRNGREYQFDLSRISSENGVVGLVLLVFDITEQVDAERNRREFTANVSHELKTPLQSIIGSAELIENAMVKPEDMSRFLGHIRKEASRLVTLIDDIIRLSELDEGGEMPREEVSLTRVAQEVLEALKDAAKAKGVTLSLSGEAKVCGVYRLLYEIIYNLCDNGIKYNVPGGSVDICLREAGDETVFTVRDTGVGIPLEHQNRVFERFYRVDKSHSKQSGGTGLGLSIVKHAVQYHHGRIVLESQPGEGTAVTVFLPRR